MNKIEQEEDFAAVLLIWIIGTAFCCGVYLATKWVATKLGFENRDAIVMGFISAAMLVIAVVTRASIKLINNQKNRISD